MFHHVILHMLMSCHFRAKVNALALEVNPIKRDSTVTRPTTDEGVLVGDVVKAAVGSHVRDSGLPQGSVFGIVRAGAEA